jgi:vancomycin resistance protein YoaR
VVEADLHLNGTEVVYAPGQIGRALDLDASLANLEAALQSFRDGEVALVVREQAPVVLDASAQAETLRGVLSAPLTLSVSNPEPGDPGPWSVNASTLAGMVTIVRVPAGNGEQVQVTLDPQALQPLLEEIASQLDRKPANARFVFNDTTKQLDLKVNAVTGRSLDVAATLAAIQSALMTGQHAVPLTVASQPPAVGDDATAASLGITELVSSQITYFRGSGTARMQNIEIAGLQFHGLLIAPGETFSMGDVLGDVSLENGYQEAMIIYNGRTIQGVGGGVCQVSTTLFRTAFFGGYPIVERTPHAYRVYYYEQNASGYDTNLAGLDATVYFPLVDFKFINDRPYWLLMEVYVNKSTQRITWKFYSTSDGRSVDWVTTGPLNVVPAPAPLYQMNASLGKDEIDQIDWPADGADITVTRTVTRNGALLFTDDFRTHYQPWQAICEYGPGTDDWAGLAKELGLCQSR